MRNKKGILSWLAPTASELVWYLFLSGLTLVLSSLAFFRTFVYAPSEFTLKELTLGTVSGLLERYVGNQITRSGVVIIFWGMVGLLVYMSIWLLMNFSDELGNDLAITKYIHPRNVDTSSPLRDFLSKTFFRVAVFIFLLFYLNFFLSILLPTSIVFYRSAVSNWPQLRCFIDGGIGLSIQLIALHIFTVLIRLLFLRKQVLI